MSTAITRVNILIKQGATFRWVIKFTNPLGEPIDLTGCHFVMQIRRSWRSGEVLVEISSYDDGITIDLPGGRALLLIEDEETATLNLEEAVYDVLLLWPNGDVWRVREGNVRVSLGVTREWPST